MDIFSPPVGSPDLTLSPLHTILAHTDTHRYNHTDKLTHKTQTYTQTHTQTHTDDLTYTQNCAPHLHPSNPSGNT